MSIFSTIIKDVESVAAKIEAAFKKLFGAAPSWVQIADNVVNYIAPIVETIATLAGEGPLVTAAVNDLKGYLATAAAAVDATATISAATTLPGLLTNIQNELPALLAAIKVENPSTVSKVETYTTLISSEIAALLASVTATAPEPPVAG